MTAAQAGLLDRAAGLVKPGGRLVYAVCSWITAEGPDQATAFRARMPGFALQSSQSLRPDQHGCDAFFIACWRKL